jgi:drug/metabolite transporter (DMT)-like permease
MVPLMHAFLAGTGLTSIPIQTWIACLLAFSGVVVMELDGRDALVDGGIFSSLSAAVDSFSHGDLLIVLAAVVYTLHVVRLGKYAKETTAVKLATAKATTEAILSVGLVLLLMTVGAASSVEGNGLLAYAQETGREITTFFSSITNGIVSGKVPTSVLLPALGAVLWTGWVTCAYTIYAQSFGQRRVSPTDANLIYTLQPIFTALFAWVLLGETLGPAGFAGAALIGSAVYTAAMMTN